MSRIVLDTNVIVSAYGFGGKPRALLEAAIDGVHEVVTSAARVAAGRDPADDRVIECALAGNAEFIVTGDDDLLALDSYEGVRIVRVVQMPVR